MISKWASILIVISMGLLAIWYLFALYRHREDDGNSHVVIRRRLADYWGFTPLALGGFSYWSLILVSVLGLFLELLLIRWISSEIRIFAYFKNFVLISCFLGFGLGCYLCRRPINLLPTFLPLLLVVLLIMLPIPSLRHVIDIMLTNALGAFSEVNVWGVPSVPISTERLVDLSAVIGITIPLFILITFIFVPIGQLLGWYLENATNGILGYTVNILGSLAGILLYTLLCFLELGPMTWFAVGGAMLVVLSWKIPVLRWSSLVVFALCVSLLSYKGGPDESVYWSPYQKLVISPVYSKDDELIRYRLTTNGSWYQQILNLSDDYVASHKSLFEGLPIDLEPYNLPFRFIDSNPESVLILGSGVGNDVAAALRNKAERIVAVEIDPTILKLGRRLHFEKPYDSSKVEVVIDDARSYIEETADRFDMIVFALLDSHTTSSYYSNIRIDNYVYTLEALKATRHLLKPEGIMVVKFQTNTPWIAGRLAGLLTKVFGYPPLQTVVFCPYSTGGRFFITGSVKQITKALSDEMLGSYVRENSNLITEQATLTTDNWPYFYQHEPGLPASVIIISVVLIGICALTLGCTGTTVRSVHWHFFFLGAGFMLLEVHIISKVALLFGTTWIVNSIVIAGLLLMIVAANILVMFVPRMPVWVAYVGLFVSMMLSYLLPTAQLFVGSLWLRILLVSAVLCLPVFFAGIIFIQSFARSEFSGKAIGSNLIGALVGGLLESLSLWSGIRVLILVGVLLYLLSLLSFRHEHRISGGEVVPGAELSS